MKVRKGILWMLCIGMAACGDRSVLQQEDVIPEGPLKKIVRSNGILYTVSLQTAEQMAYLRAYNSKDQQLDAQRYTEELENTKGHYFFVITQKGKNGRNVLEQDASGTEDYARRLQYYQADAQQDIRMVTCNDTLVPDAYLYENNLGIVAENRMVAAFPAGDGNCDVQLVFNDRAFENYLIKARFEYNNIKNAPKTRQN